MEAALRASLATLLGVREDFIAAEARRWWEEEVRRFVAPGAHRALARHREARHRLVLLTSSSKYAAQMALEEFGLDAVLHQHYDVRDGCFTGEFLRPICFGAGKVEAAEAWAREAGVDLAASSFYTDSFTDLPMLERVGH